jgi:hypothetical protein
VTADVTVLETPDEYRVDAGTGNDPELTEGGYRIREAPVGHANAHSALDNDG